MRESATFAIATLGCKVNQYDSHAVARALRAHGLRQVPFHQHADAYIVDTCTVTAMADRKSRKTLSRAARRNPNAVFVATGCAVEWAADQFLHIRPDCLIVGNREKPQLAERLLGVLHSRGTFADCDGEVAPNPEPRTLNPARSGNGLCEIRAALKVQDGCNRTCTYCIIPSVRGAPYSRPMSELLREARELVAEGARELVLTGVLLGTYGCEEGWRRRRERHPLAELMTRLHDIDNLARIRLSTIDPRDVHDDLLAAMATLPKCCPHVHLPLQAGSDVVLKLMKRGYTCAQFAERVAALRSAMPDMGLTTDIMVALPGETDEHFAETMAFARALRFSGIHVFPFSPRPGTAAEHLPGRVAPEVAAARVEALLALAREQATNFAQQRIGRAVEILVEEFDASTETVRGMTRDHIPVSGKHAIGDSLGQLVKLVPKTWEGKRLVA